MAKIKEKLKKIPLPIILASVFMLFLLIVVVALIIPGEKAKTQISAVKSEKTEKNQQVPDAPIFPSAKEAEEKEKEFLEQQKKFLGKVEKPTDEQKKINEEVKKVVEQNASAENYKMKPPEMPGQPSMETETQKIEQNAKQQLFQQFLAYMPATGKRISTSDSKSGSTSTSNNQTTQELSNLINKEKFYRATLLTTVDNIKQSKVYAEITDPLLRGAKLIGKNSYSEMDDRITITFDTMLYNGKTYKVKATAYSVDKIAGVVSHVKYNNIAKMQAVGATAFAQAMLDALRKDTTTTTSTLWGEQTSEQKSSNRLREGLLAGGSAAFEEIKNALTQSYSKVPDKIIIAEKGTPIYVAFDDENEK